MLVQKQKLIMIMRVYNESNRQVCSCNFPHANLPELLDLKIDVVKYM